MSTLARDPVARVLALVAGAAIGLRAAQVAHAGYESGSYYALSGGFTVLGLVGTVIFVLGLAAWRFNRSPDGNGGSRLVALAAGLIVGGVVGWMLFRAA